MAIPYVSSHPTNTVPADALVSARICSYADTLAIQYIVCRQISNIGRTKYQNLNVSRIILQLYLCTILQPRVNSLRPGDAYMRQ